MQDATELLLLLPKTRPPRAASKLILRPRLAQHVRMIEDVRLTVVSAPSGFGKTTIGTVWAKELKNKSTVVSWLGLEKEDDEPSRFYNYLAFTINHALKEHAGDSARGPDAIQSLLKGNQLIARLINNIAEDGGEFFLFLDDFQVITNQAIRNSIQFLIQHAPSNFHLVVLSHPHGVADFQRGKPGTELYLQAGDLRFTEAETKELFDAYSRQDDQASSAHFVTGGWAAALRILAASDAASGGHNANGKAYLLTENYLGNLLKVVLSGLSEDEVSLIEMTCIVGKMCGPLFSALTGIEQPRNIIHAVENTHSLVSRITDDGYWFRCHDLIRESVIAHASDATPGRVTDIANRASRWYAEQGLWSDAVALALAVDNRELALQTIERCSTKVLYKGDLLTLMGWEDRLNLSRLPSTSIKTLTVLALTSILAADQEHNEHLGRLLDLTDARMRKELPAEAIEIVHWHLQAIRAILACRNDALATALDLSVKCLEQPVVFPSLTESVRCTAGYSHLQFRQWDEFYKVVTEVSRTTEDEFTFLAIQYRQVLLGLASIVQLNFPRALRYLEDVHKAVHKKLGAISMPGALADGLMGYIYCETLEVEKADNLLSGTLDLVAQSGYIDCIWRAYVSAYRIALLRHENEYALSILEKWERTVAGSHGVRPHILCAYEKMCFFLREENHPRAGATLAHIRELYDAAAAETTRMPSEIKSFSGLAQGQYALATGGLDEAKSHLEVTYQDATRDADPHMVLLSGLALALAEFRSGNNEGSCTYLFAVLSLAQTNGLKASVLCQPGDIWPMLDMYKINTSRRPASARHEAYIDEIRDARDRNFNKVTVSLSPREESVLRLIAQDKSNKEISIALKITPETVKTHLKSIFSKLNVTKRNSAVRRANAIKLI